MFQKLEIKIFWKDTIQLTTATFRAFLYLFVVLCQICFIHKRKNLRGMGLLQNTSFFNT